MTISNQSGDVDAHGGNMPGTDSAVGSSWA